MILKLSNLFALSCLAAGVGAQTPAPGNVVMYYDCTVTNKTHVLQLYSDLAKNNEDTPGIEALSIMDVADDQVAMVEAFNRAEDYLGFVNSNTDAVTAIVGFFESCDLTVWGGWTEEMKEATTGAPGTQWYAENQDGYIDFCRDGASTSHNFPHMFFFNGRRVAEGTTEQNRAVLKAMGDFYTENVPGVMGWITAVDPDQPDVVRDFQLFRDIYIMQDHADPRVITPLMDEYFPGLLGTWVQPFDYNATFVGYVELNPTARLEYEANGFPDVRDVNFYARGTEDGEYMGFQRFCAGQAVDCMTEEESIDANETAVEKAAEADTEAEDPDMGTRSLRAQS